MVKLTGGFVLVFSLLKACNAASEPVRQSAESHKREVSSQGQTAMRNLHMSVFASVEEQELVIRYGVENDGNSDVYLLNRVHDHALEPKPEYVYIDLIEAERTVHVYKDIPAIPAGSAPVMPYSPYVTPVRAHGRFGETVRIALPVRSRAAYAPDSHGNVATTYMKLTFTIGFYRSVPGMREVVKHTAAGADFISPQPPPGTRLEFGKLEYQKDLSVPVLQ